MPPSERQPHHHHDGGEPLAPSPLPPELAAFLAERPCAALFHATDQGTVLVVKLPSWEIASLRGRVLIRITHELYQHMAAPVIRTVVRIYDQPTNPMMLETFTNVADEEQRADLDALARQRTLHLLFYDESLAHRLSKGVKQVQGEDIREILRQADAARSRIAPEDFDFDQAKAAVMRQARP